MRKMEVWSSGGGVQSTAIACLIADGRLPKPDLAVIADTGREASTTWLYLQHHVQPMLDKVGVKVEIASHDLATVDLYARGGSILIPAYTDHTGKVGQLPGYCSVEWKRRVVRRWLKRRGVKHCRVWLGISMDEIGRAKPSDVKWLEHTHPLIDLGFRRTDCLKVVEAAGLPMPPKSSCWMCPYRGPKEWALLTEDDRRKAELFEHEMKVADPTLSLRRDQRPLGDAWDGEPKTNPLFGEVTQCDSGYCWT